MSTPVDHERPAPATTPRQRRWLVPVAAAAAVAALASTPLWWPGGDSSRTSVAGQADTPSSPAVDELTEPDGAFRALLDAPGWQVDSETKWSASEGEIAFEDDGGGEMTLRWMPAARYAEYVEDRRHIDEPPRDGEPVTVDGAAAQLWAYSDTDHTVIREVADGHWLEVRGTGMGRAAFLDLLTQVRMVDPETYRAELPPTGRNSKDLVRLLVSDIEEVSGAGLPAGVTEVDLAVPETSEVGLDVSRGYACAWIEAYVDATTSGDQAGRDEARRVLRTAPRWPVVAARANADSMLVPSITGWAALAAGGRPVGRLEGFRDDLGC